MESGGCLACVFGMCGRCVIVMRCVRVPRLENGVVMAMIVMMVRSMMVARATKVRMAVMRPVPVSQAEDQTRQTVQDSADMPVHLTPPFRDDGCGRHDIWLLRSCSEQQNHASSSEPRPAKSRRCRRACIFLRARCNSRLTLRAVSFSR